MLAPPLLGCPTTSPRARPAGQPPLGPGTRAVAAGVVGVAGGRPHCLLLGRCAAQLGRVCRWARSRKLRRSSGIGSVGERRSAWITAVCCTRGRGLAGMESAGSGESGLDHELGWSAGRRCSACVDAARHPPGADTGRQPPTRDTMSVCGEPASPMRQHTHTHIHTS
jgi:hypothetical protein